MARDISTAFAAETLASTLRPCLLVEGLFDSGALRVWSGFGILTWNGEDYQGAGSLLSVSDIEETQEVRATGASIQLSGIPTELRSLVLSEPYQGRPVNVYLGVLDGAWALIGDPYLLYGGRADVATIDKAGGTMTITLNVESGLVDLEVPRLRRYTDEDQRIDYPDDKGFEYVAGLQDKPIKWGSG